MKNHRPASRFAWICCLWAVLGAGCGGTKPSELPIDELPAYEDESSDWFDDSLSPAIFGLSGNTDVIREPFWAQLVVASDHISRVRLTTVTRARTGDQVSYRVVLRPIGDPIRGPSLDDAVEVRVGLESPSIGLLHSLDTEAVGKKFIVFLKRFRSNSQAVWHFRGLAESAKTLEAIEHVN